MTVQAFEDLSMRKDLLVSPMRLGNDYGHPAIRCKVLTYEGPDGPRTQAVAPLLLPPGRRQRVTTLDGNPFNLLPENLAPVDLPQFVPAVSDTSWRPVPPAAPVIPGAATEGDQRERTAQVCSLLAPVRQ